MSPRPKRQSELLAPGEYERMLAEQGGGCAICGATAKTRRLAIDHDHATGKIRGLLCHSHNRRLWGGATSAELRAMAAYLERAA